MTYGFAGLARRAAPFHVVVDRAQRTVACVVLLRVRARVRARARVLVRGSVAAQTLASTRSTVRD